MANSRADEIKKKVTIPMYMYNIVIPQMADYYNDYTVNFESDPRSKCCFHDENTPSMRWYDETNTFFCFGCRAGGDIIQFHRLFTEKMVGTKPSFNEAIEFLYNYFLKGNEHIEAVVVNNNNIEYKSTKSEIARLSSYCTQLEGQLEIDNSLKEDTKRKIWGAIDEMSILISLNKVNATDAMNYIKGVVKESIKH